MRRENCVLNEVHKALDKVRRALDEVCRENRALNKVQQQKRKVTILATVEISGMWVRVQIHWVIGRLLFVPTNFSAHIAQSISSSLHWHTWFGIPYLVRPPWPPAWPAPSQSQCDQSTQQCVEVWIHTAEKKVREQGLQNQCFWCHLRHVVFTVAIWAKKVQCRWERLQAVQ